MDDRDLRVCTPICTPHEVANLVGMPANTVYSWTKQRGQRPFLLHSVGNLRRGWPTIPVIGLAEAHVVRTLRASLPMRAVTDFVNWLRNDAGDPYALACPKVVTDGIDIYVQGNQGLERALDGQRPIAETIEHHLREIVIWPDGYAGAYCPPQLKSQAVEMDPRFSAGRMVFQRNRVPLFAPVGELVAGEDHHIVARNYGLTSSEVDLLVDNLEWLAKAA